MIIETKAYQSGSYAGRPVWRGKFRITKIGNGFDVGWTLATNAQGQPIAYEDRASALAGAQVCGEEFGKGFK